ncbi:hypothetical protein ACIB24_16565 [Spongisporangium articulatum]|uniref:Uncharacterized protein n=1 Tax=Spongisporangium articulatum TaxID=3362603 RepID=A0ABW8AQN5_9ACTN
MPYPWYIVSSLSSVVATLIVVAAAVYGHFQLGELRRARNVAALMEFHDYYHSLPVRDVRGRLLSGELGGPAELIDSRHALAPEDDHRLWQMVDKLEFLAALVNRRLVDFDVAYSIFSWSPPLVWAKIEPVVVHHRARGNPQYCVNLERLVTSYAAQERRR